MPRIRPTSGGGRYSMKNGKWVRSDREKVFDYSKIDRKAAALLVSFYRYYPDYFYDLIRSPKAKYKLELPQRIMFRAFARYRNVYITGCRGLTKTFVIMGSKEHDGVFFPGEIIRYCAPSQKQSAILASAAFSAFSEEYPLMASWWNKNNDRADLFRITTDYGSEFTMYAPRGDNSSQIIGEEMGQEGEDGFDMETFESQVSPACRLDRKIKGVPDRTHINMKEHYIANACSRENKAFYKYRYSAIKDMIYGAPYDGIAMDISWVSALLCNLRDINYYKKEKSKLSPENWLREMCVRYIGSGESPMISDETLAKSKRLQVAEFAHCKDPEAIYIVSHDVSYADGRKNAKCADAVLKLTKFQNVSRRDKYRAQCVFVDNYPPPNTAYLQAQKLKNLWMKFCMDGGQTTYLVVDTQAYGTDVVEELMKPATDGSPNLCCVNHCAFTEIEQKNALPVIYPLKSGVPGSADPEGDMINYAQGEFEKGNVELLISNVLDGVEAYKNAHGIKEDSADAKIAVVYKNSELLCQQISNLQTKVSGTSTKETRKSKHIQRDIWSALKYALRMKCRLEAELVKETYKSGSSWSAMIEAYANGSMARMQMPGDKGDRTRAKLLSLRRR